MVSSPDEVRGMPSSLSDYTAGGWGLDMYIVFSGTNFTTLHLTYPHNEL